MKPSETAQVLAQLADAFEKRITESMLRAYHAALGDLPVSVASEAAARCIAGSEFFPRPAALRKAAAELADGSCEADSALAWEATLKAIRRWGRYRETQGLASLPPRTAAAARAVGWQAICDSTLPAAERKAYYAAYEALQRDGIRAVQLPPPGGSEGTPALSAAVRVAQALSSGDGRSK